MTEFYGPLSGQNYSTAEARDYWERITSQKIAASQTSDPFDDYNAPSADDIKAAHRVAIDSQKDQAREIADHAAAEVFLQLHPEYTASPKLANAFETYFDLRGRTLDQSVTVEQLEEAADYLTRRGMIAVNEQAIAAERKNEAQEMANEIRQARRASGISTRSGISARAVSRSARKSYTEDDLYNMSLDELRALAVKESGESEAW